MELRKEVLPMTRSEAIKAFFFKSVLPVIVALILYCIFKSACMKNGELDYVWLWILCGLPFGLHRMCLWIVPGGGSLGGGIALFALNFIIGGVIGGFILAWRLIVAVWYVPLTVYRLIVGCFLRHGNMENCRSCRWKSHSQPDGKRQAFSHKSANSFPTASQSWQFTHIPTTPTAAAIHPFLSNPNEKILWKFLFNGGTICTPVQTTEPC